MKATLYLPHQQPKEMPIEGLVMPDPETGFVKVPEQVPLLLGCTLGMVDVLFTGPRSVAYSIFDFEGDENPNAMAALAELMGEQIDPLDEDMILQGPILVVLG